MSDATPLDRIAASLEEALAIYNAKDRFDAELAETVSQLQAQNRRLNEELADKSRIFMQLMADIRRDKDRIAELEQKIQKFPFDAPKPRSKGTFMERFFGRVRSDPKMMTCPNCYALLWKPPNNLPLQCPYCRNDVIKNYGGNHEAMQGIPTEGAKHTNANFNFNRDLAGYALNAPKCPGCGSNTPDISIGVCKDPFHGTVTTPAAQDTG